MAGNFRGVLISLFSWLTWQSRNFPPTKINAYGDMVLCESMMMGVATNIVAVWLTLSSMASNSSHCHPADSVFDTNILLSHAICVSVCIYGLVTKKIASACIDYIIACAVLPRP